MVLEPLCLIDAYLTTQETQAVKEGKDAWKAETGKSAIMSHFKTPSQFMSMCLGKEKGLKLHR